MKVPGATPLFVDTGAFYARADANDRHHTVATNVFDGIRSGEVVHRPVYTSQAVLSEFSTLALYKLGHGVALRSLTSIVTSSSINVIPVRASTFEAATDQFRIYDDQEISFVDHTSSVLAAERGVDHIFSFDSDFRTLGFTTVPEDVVV